MKKKLVFCCLAALMMAVTVSSCKKDDQPERRKVDSIKLEDVFRNTPGYQVAMTNGSTPDSYAGSLLMNEGLKSSNGLTFAWAGLGVEILKGAAYQFGSQLMSKAFPAISDAIFGKGDQQDASMQALQALDEMRAQLGVIDSKLDQIAALANEIMSKLEDMEFNQMYQYFTKFNGKLREMDLSCMECFNKMRPDMSEEELKALVLKWGEGIVSGNQAPFPRRPDDFFLPGGSFGDYKTHQYEDMAKLHWSEQWRLPTKEEFQGLLDNCTLESTTVGGVKGWKFTGKGEYSGNSIFLPATGYGSLREWMNKENSGYYWSSTANSDENAYVFKWDDNGKPAVNSFTKYHGCVVRPVTDEASKPELPESVLPGSFSISADYSVHFTKSNLYYDYKDEAFHFEENQYDYPDEWDIYHVGHFFWSEKESEAYAKSNDNHSKPYQDFFTNYDASTPRADFTVEGITGKYRVLARLE